MMNANAKAWVAAMRSGAWRQAQRRLRREDRYGGPPGYCCLGVGTELARSVIGGEWSAAYLDGVSYRLGGQEYTHFLPPPVREWLGVCTQDGAFKGTLGEALSAALVEGLEAATGLEGKLFEAESLAELNDCGATLEQIAAVIELEPDGLFEVAA